MGFLVEEVRTVLANKVTSVPKTIKQEHRLEAGGRGAHLEAIIDLSNVNLLNNNIEGTFYIKVRYGHPKKLRYEAENAYAVFISFNKNGDISNLEHSNIDAAEFLKGGSSVSWQVFKPSGGATVAET